MRTAKRTMGLTCLVMVALLAGCATGKMPTGYRVEVGEGEDVISVVVVRGTPYEMGKAFGSLMKEEAQACAPAFMAAAKKKAGPLVSDLVLQMAWNSQVKYIDKRFVEEIRGLAEGAGVSFETISRAHMIPVIAPYSCSGVIVWGDATKDGHLYQLRNLDFTKDGSLQDYPAVVVYIPNEGIPHVNVSFAGVASVNTGMNAEGISLGEKGEAPASELPYKLNGDHFATLFRKVLYDAHTLDEAVAILQSADRIKKYYWYVGDGKAPKGVKIKAFAPDMQVWNGGDSSDELAPKVVPNAVYQTMNNKLAYKNLSQPGFKHDAQTMIELSKALASKDGNLLNVVYDATTLELYVAYAEKQQDACFRPYVHIRLKDYLNAKKVPEGAVVYQEEK